MNGRRALYMDLYPHHMEVRRAATRLDPRLLGLTMALLALTAAAGLLYLSQASTVAQLRYCLADNEQEQAALLERIALLRSQVAASQSFGTLEQRVDQLGLVDAPADGPTIVYYVDPVGTGGSGPGASAMRDPFDRLYAVLVPGQSSQAARPGLP